MIDQPITLNGADNIGKLFDALNNESDAVAGGAFIVLMDMKQWMIDNEMFICLNDFKKLEKAHGVFIKFRDLQGSPVLA